MVKLIFLLLNKLKNHNDRQNYGIACGIAGIVLNVLLFIAKIIIGFISGSIAITADAFNNLSDVGSSTISLLGFVLAGKKPDPHHPFGHGRFEYVAGLIVSLMIILMGLELLIGSFKKIINPEPISFSVTLIIVLVVAIFVKLYMAYYNFTIGKKIDSLTIIAAGKDSLSDVLATTIVMISTLIFYYLKLNIDGYAGLLVALFILKTGYQSAEETINPLLGQAPNPKLIQQIKEIIKEYPEISGIHDLIVHDYGHDSLMVTLHAEVSANSDILTMHDVINEAEEKIKETLQCHATIHMDPIVNDDEYTNQLKQKILNKLEKMDERISIHDFRLIKSKHHPKLFFDVTVPYDIQTNDEELKIEITEMINSLNSNLQINIEIDRH